jgi:hypothetical protein
MKTSSEAVTRVADGYTRASVAIERPLTGPLRVFAPYSVSKEWFRETTGFQASKLLWEMRAPAHWVVGRGHLSAVTFGLAEMYGDVELIMEYRQAEQCGLKCQQATNVDCTCACLGRQHGGPTNLNHLAIEDIETRPGRVTRVRRRVVYPPTPP